MKIDRRRFIRVSLTGAAAAGAAAFMANSDWLFPKAYPGDTKKLFAKCGTCSRTFFCLLNREFGHPKKAEELASDPFGGGMMSTQNQCGMLWGAVLATGAESFRRFSDPDQAVNQAILSSQYIVNSFSKRAKTLNCRDIIGFDMSETWKRTGFLLESLPGGFSNIVCMNLAEKWAPEAIDAARRSFTSEKSNQIPLSCAAEVAKKMGASAEEIVTVSGLGGGIGLSGHGCGALGTAIFISSLNWCKKHPGQSGYLNPKSKVILKAFQDITHSELVCSKISGQRFRTFEDHSDFVKNGGCSKIIDALANA